MGTGADLGRPRLGCCLSLLFYCCLQLLSLSLSLSLSLAPLISFTGVPVKLGQEALEMAGGHLGRESGVRLGLSLQKAGRRPGIRSEALPGSAVSKPGSWHPFLPPFCALLPLFLPLPPLFF